MLMNGPSFVQAGFPIDESKRSLTSQESKDRYGNWDERDIHRFLPERYLVKDDNGQNTFNTLAGPKLPYGAGLRSCFGKSPPRTISFLIATDLMVQ
jgi:hypothetical protein